MKLTTILLLTTLTTMAFAATGSVTATSTTATTSAIPLPKEKPVHVRMENHCGTNCAQCSDASGVVVPSKYCLTCVNAGFLEPNTPRQRCSTTPITGCITAQVKGIFIKCTTCDSANGYHYDNNGGCVLCKGTNIDKVLKDNVCVARTKTLVKCASGSTT